MKNNIVTEPQQACYSIYDGQNMFDVSDGIEGIENRTFDSDPESDEKTESTKSSDDDEL